MSLVGMYFVALMDRLRIRAIANYTEGANGGTSPIIVDISDMTPILFGSV